LNWIIALFVIILVTDTTAHVLILKGQRKIMATGQALLDAANKLATGLTNMETRLDKLIADIKAPSVADVTASDSALATLQSMATALDAFHAPAAVVTSTTPPPTP
jgi:hypothetical protein